MTKEEKRQQEKETEADRELRLEVFMRDHGCDRAFGDPLVFEGDAIATRSECHHIVFRSQGGSDEMSNLATLNVRAHQMVHDGKLSVAGNANETLIFTEKNLETGAIVRQWESPNPSGVSNRKSTEQGHQS